MLSLSFTDTIRPIEHYNKICKTNLKEVRQLKRTHINKIHVHRHNTVFFYGWYNEVNFILKLLKLLEKLYILQSRVFLARI